MNLFLKSICVDTANLPISRTGYTIVEAKTEISNCFFTRTNVYNGWGGVIYSSQKNFNVVIVDCTFFACSCNSWGGAIWLDSINKLSSSKLLKVCASECFAKYGHFASICPYKGFNDIQYVSISKCSPFEDAEKYTFYLGKYVSVSVMNLNSSNNKASERSGIHVLCPTTFVGEFWTIVDNVANSECIFFNYNGQSIDLSNANIVNNKCTYGGVVSLFNGAVVTIHDCIFSQNSNLLFFAQFSSKIYLSNCVINHSDKIRSGTIYSENIQYTVTSTFVINHPNFQYCPAN